MTRRDIRIERIEVTGRGEEGTVHAALAELPTVLRAVLAGAPAPAASPLALAMARDVAAAIRRGGHEEQ